LQPSRLGFGVYALYLSTQRKQKRKLLLFDPVDRVAPKMTTLTSSAINQRTIARSRSRFAEPPNTNLRAFCVAASNAASSSAVDNLLDLARQKGLSRGTEARRQHVDRGPPACMSGIAPPKMAVSPN
jgi:hypothetical protein